MQQCVYMLPYKQYERWGVYFERVTVRFYQVSDGERLAQILRNAAAVWSAHVKWCN